MKTINSNFWRSLSIGLCCSLLITVGACSGSADNTEGTTTAETTTGMETTTTDTWDNERFSTSFTSTGRFGGWDENNDIMLDQNEFTNSYYDTWDVNNDDVIDEDEWNNASRDFGMQGQNMTDWDTNRDSRIDKNEFTTGFGNNNYYRDWDTDRDKMISEEEYSRGIFNTWDTNRDGTLSNDEYDTRYNRYYGNNR